MRAVCRRTEADGTVAHRVRVASSWLAGHHVAEIRGDGAVISPSGRRVPATVRAAVEDVAAHLAAAATAPGLPVAA